METYKYFLSSCLINNQASKGEKKESPVLKSTDMDWLANRGPTSCSFSEHRLGHCAANPSAHHVLVWRHVCQPDEDAKVHS
jgi:hypothetical protein